MAEADQRGEARATQSGIQTFEASHVAAVAELFQSTFRRPRDPAPDALRNYLEDIFLNHRLSDPDICSLVFVDSGGKVAGFIGVLPARLTFGGEPLRAAVAGSLMVDNPAENPLAGARLLRSFLSGPQDLSISESANALSAGMWERLGHKPIAAYSLDWVRVLRPAGFGVAALASGFRPAKMLSPLAMAVDAGLGRIARNPFRLESGRRGGGLAADVGDDELVAHIPEFIEQFAVRPDWDDDGLRWILAHADRKKRYGRTFKRLVYGKGGKPLGCYIYYGRPRGIAWVLQILARPDSTAAVLGDLLRHAHDLGSVAVRGRAHPSMMNVLTRENAFFFSRSSTVVCSRNADLTGAINSGDALVTGLAAEAWIRLIGDEFDQ